MNRRFAVVFAITLGAAAVAFQGCGSSGNIIESLDAASDGPEPDAGSVSDVSTDGGSVSAPDSRSDGTADAGFDATTDGGADSGVDTGTDAPADAGFLDTGSVDAGSPDAPIDSPIDSPADAADANVLCADGGPPPCVIVLATEQHAPIGIAVDEANVYWTTYGTSAYDAGSVLRTPIGGGPIVTIASGESEPVELALDTGHVYWSLLTGSALMEATLDGGPPTLLLGSQPTPQGIAVDDTNVYWASGSSVYQAPKVGVSPVTPLASGVGNPQGPFLHGGDVYFTDFNNGLVERVPVAPVAVGVDAGAAILASGQKHPGFIAFDSTNLYWYNGGDSAAVTNGSIVMLPLVNTDGGLPVPLAINRAFGEVILVDGPTVYWAEGSTIQQLTLPSGSPRPFLTTTSAITYMIQDPANIYWTSATSGTVNQVAKF